MAYSMMALKAVCCSFLAKSGPSKTLSAIDSSEVASAGAAAAFDALGVAAAAVAAGLPPLAGVADIPERVELPGTHETRVAASVMIRAARGH